MGQYSVRDLSVSGEIDRIKKDLQQIKSSQGVGSDIINPKQNSTSSAADLTLPDYYANLSIEFTAEHQKNPNGVIICKVYRGSIGTPAATGTFEITSQDTDFTRDDGKISWLLNVYNEAAGTLYLKTYVLASDTGTVVTGAPY